MSQFPRDEFDRVPENSARHGVHRATLEAPRRSLVPLMIFGVAALCIGLLAFFIVPRLGSPKELGAASVSHTTASASAPASVSPSAPAPTTAPTTPAPTSASPSPTPTPGAVVDKSVPVAVLNATGISGLAAKYASTVTADGWTVSQAGNWVGAAQGTSSIVYAGAPQKANAEALGKLLNIPTLVDSSDLGGPLTVILGPGAQ